MRDIVWVLGVLMGACTGCAPRVPTESGSAPLARLNWQVGEVQTYRMTKSRVREDPDEPISVSASCPLRVEVLAAR